MKRRHALRFENGERQGELWILEETGSEGAVTVGRRSGNACVLKDASVSGLHAELSVSEQGVTLRDLGSTNGTRVGNERVTERRLALGDVLHFGNVRATYVDPAAPEDVTGEAATPAAPRPAAAPAAPQPTAPAPAALPAGAAGDDVHTVSANTLARSRRVSPAGLAALVSIAVAAGAAWFWLRGRESAGAGSLARPVVPVPGNLLAEGYSFEAQGPDRATPDGRASPDVGAPGVGANGDRWVPSEDAPASFGLDPSARRTGEGGLAVGLAAGEWAEHASEAVGVARGANLTLDAWARVEGAHAVLGLRFESAAGQARPITVWSAPSRAEDFEPLELRALVPPGYDSARAVLRAARGSRRGRGPGRARRRQPGGHAALDRRSRGARAPTEPTSIGEYELAALGDPPTVVNLFKIDRVLLSGLAVEAGDERAGFTREARENGLALFPSGAGTLVFTAEPELASLGVATLAASEGGGYRTHQVEFERDGVRTILLGAGRDLVCLAFPSPVAVRARPGDGGFHFEVPIEAGAEVALQLAFQAERNAAQVAARDARAAEQRGESGAALQLWGRVQNELPYDESLLGEAEAARGRLISQGLAELRELERRFERARFFRLVDDFRACLADARALAQRYAASEVEGGARALEGSIAEELAVLSVDLERHERERLTAIARSLEAAGKGELSTRVQDYLRENFEGPAEPAEAAAAEDG